MFSEGQWWFAGFFVIAFVILMIFSYRGDKKLHKKHYKGSLKILLGFVGFVVLLFVLKVLLKE